MVGAACAVSSCFNTYSKAKKRGLVLSLHTFPKDRRLRALWIEACTRGDAWNPDTSFICSDHFALEDFESDQRLQLWTGVKWRPHLKSGAVPSRNLLGATKSSINKANIRYSQRMPSMFQYLSAEIDCKVTQNTDPGISVEPTVGITERLNGMEGPDVTSPENADDACQNTGLTEVDRSYGLTVDVSTKRTTDPVEDMHCDGSPERFYPCSPNKSKNVTQFTHTDLEFPNPDATPKNDTLIHQNNFQESNKMKWFTDNSRVIYSCPEFELYVDD